MKFPDVSINDELLLIDLGAWMLVAYEAGHEWDEIMDGIIHKTTILDFVTRDALNEVAEGVKSAVTDVEQENHDNNREDLLNGR